VSNIFVIEASSFLLEWLNGQSPLREEMKDLHLAPTGVGHNPTIRTTNLMAAAPIPSSRSAQ